MVRYTATEMYFEGIQDQKRTSYVTPNVSTSLFWEKVSSYPPSSNHESRSHQIAI